MSEQWYASLLTQRMAARYLGQTAYIVGRGPSLLELRKDDFGPGPVIVLNAAIQQIRALELPNPIYWMWKDGCQPHTPLDNEPGDHDCTIQPRMPEVFITSLAEGRFCAVDYPLRRVIDVQGEYGIPWWTMSAQVAVEFAHDMGCTSLVMYGHDAYTSKGQDTRHVLEGGQLQDNPHAGYYNAGLGADTRAREYGMAIEWRTKVTA